MFRSEYSEFKIEDKRSRSSQYDKNEKHSEKMDFFHTAVRETIGNGRVATPFYMIERRHI